MRRGPGILRRLADGGDDRSLAARLRRRRFRLFERMVEALPRPVRILDVGGTASYWLAMGVTASHGYDVTLLNRTAPDPPAPFLHAVLGDATDLSRFPDGAFDVAFSNSVIEHVGDRAAQERMAAELMRVGQAYYVQTPDRRFPVEPHFLLPWFQYWPLPWRVALVRRRAVSWYPRMPDAAEARAFVESFRLLDATELRALFPGATIHHERVLGLSKSLVACGAVAPLPASPVI